MALLLSINTAYQYSDIEFKHWLLFYINIVFIATSLIMIDAIAVSSISFFYYDNFLD